MSDNKRIALLIDCDNVGHNAIEGVLEELAKYGMVNIRHAHGDWNSKHLLGWKDKLHNNAIRPMQQFAYTKGKNATDSAMIIDAMDLLHGQNVDAFALMTSDSDFTPLVLRIKESGLPVYGFGNKKTPKPFVDACSPFIYIENLTIDDKDEIDKPKQLTKRDSKTLRQDTALVRLLRTAVEHTSDDEGWSYISQVGSYIAKNNGSFSSLNFGYKKFSDLIKETVLFEISKGEKGHLRIKDKRK